MNQQVDQRLSGKVAVITGASQGIGAAVARLFAEQGASIVLGARNLTAMDRVAADIEAAGGMAMSVVTDVGDPQATRGLIDAALAECGQLDILVHNAGIFPYDPLEEMTEESWQEVLNVNLSSGFRLTRQCIPHLKGRGGRILFTSSVQGNRAAVAGCAHYAASKAGINGFIRAAALELAGFGITVNGVEPGLVLTPGTESAMSEKQQARMAELVPVKRWGEAKEIAQAMLYLASDEAAYVTGQTIVVDGGALLPVSGALPI